MPGESPLIWPTFEGKKPAEAPWVCDRCQLPMQGRPALRLFAHYVDGMTVQWEFCGVCAESFAWWRGPIDAGGKL